MRRVFFIVGYPVRLIVVLMACLVDPDMWGRRGEILGRGK